MVLKLYKLTLVFKFNWELSYLKSKNSKKVTQLFLFAMFINQIKCNLDKKNIKLRYYIKKKNSRDIVLLKAAFRNKIPKHILNKSQNRLIVEILFFLKNNIAMPAATVNNVLDSKKVLDYFSSFFTIAGLCLIKKKYNTYVNINSFFQKN